MSVNEVLNDPAAKEALVLGLQDIRQVQPSFKPNAETSFFIHLAEPGWSSGWFSLPP